MKISSSAFQEGDRVPVEHARDGADRSPPLRLEDIPDGTRSIALIVDDPDAPTKTWVHWLIWGLPADQGTIPEGVPGEPTLDSLGGARQGTNDFGDLGYGGPSPPRGHGPHHYRFTAYALDGAVDVAPGARRGALEAAMGEHILATARITAIYERS